MYTITETDSGKFALKYEPPSEARHRGAQPRALGTFRTRKAAELARDRLQGRLYRAWFKRDGDSVPAEGSIIYERRPSGNLIGELPAGARPLPKGWCGTLDRQDGGDPYEQALFTTPSGQTVVVEWQP